MEKFFIETDDEDESEDSNNQEDEDEDQDDSEEEPLVNTTATKQVDMSPGSYVAMQATGNTIFVGLVTPTKRKFAKSIQVQYMQALSDDSGCYELCPDEENPNLPWLVMMPKNIMFENVKFTACQNCNNLHMGEQQWADLRTKLNKQTK